MFPIYQSLYKHLPPGLFPVGQTPGKLEGPNGQFFVAAAAAAAMEQVASAASKLDQRSDHESISPSPPVVQTSDQTKQPFLKFSVSAILSKAKQEITEDQEEAVKTSEQSKF